jgi:hypothetical protein
MPALAVYAVSRGWSAPSLPSLVQCNRGKSRGCPCRRWNRVCMAATRCREARGASRGNAERFPVQRRVFPQLALRASRQRCRSASRTQRPQAAPRAALHVRHDGQRPPLQAAAAPRRPRSPGGATARPTGRTLAAATSGQACGGHGWGRVHVKPRHRASLCFAGLRRLLKGRLPGGHRRRQFHPAGSRRSAAATVARRCDRPPDWSHLGCDHVGPSLRGPWMAPQA